jgi:hypothetical protein
MTTNAQRSNSTTTVPTTVDLQISDFLVKSISKSERGVAEVNSFFNSTQIKSELHWGLLIETLLNGQCRGLTGVSFILLPMG